MQPSSFQPRPDPRPLIEKALEQAIKLSTGEKRYLIRNGRLIHEERRRYRYAYKLERSWDLADGTDLQLRSSDFEGLPCQLSHTKDDTVTIITTQRLPDLTLDHAQLIIDHAYLLRRLKDALDTRKVPATPAQLGLKLFGHLDCPDLVAPQRLVDEIKEVFSPDQAQYLAIQRALASELLVILGPPGTGKTDVLAAIALLHALLFNHRVLICSHTNIAVDHAIIRLVGFIRKRELAYRLDDHFVVRFGDPHLAKLEDDSYSKVTMPLIVADSIQQQREEIACMECRRDEVLKQLASDEAELPRQRTTWERRKREIARERERAKAALGALEEKEHQTLAPMQRQLAALRTQAQQAEQIRERARASWWADEATRQPLVQECQEKRRQREQIMEKVQRRSAYKPFKRFWVQLVTNEWNAHLETEIRNLTTALVALEKQIEFLQQRQTTTHAMYQQAEQRGKELEASITRWTRQYDEQVAFFQKEKRDVLQKIKELDQERQVGDARLAQLEKAIEKGVQERALIEDALAFLDQQVIEARREAAREVVESAQIVGATLTSLYLNPVLLDQEWDVVIVDEGSMAPPPAVLLAANRARAHLVVVGDPLQLAPICKFQDKLVQHWLGCDIFALGGYTLKQAITATHHSVLLPYQGRMAPPICDLIRGPVYKGCLKDRDPQRPRPKFGPEPEHPVVLYDTSSMAQARAEQPASKSSRFNACHAGIAVRLAQLVLASMEDADRTPECIGIVTPYAAHREVIKDLARGMNLETLIRVGTVHAFQGLEFDALIFDLVESPGLPIAPFLQQGWGSNAMRLMNVAVTRARHKLLIVANMDYIRKNAPNSYILRQVTELACQKRCMPAEKLFIARRMGENREGTA